MAQRLSDYTNALADAGTLDGSEVLYLASNEKTTVGAVRGGYTTTTVSISSAQLLACDVTPVQLLTDAGVGKYYSDVHFTFKFTYGTVDYAGLCTLLEVIQTNNLELFAKIDADLLKYGVDTYVDFNCQSPTVNGADAYIKVATLNDGFSLRANGTVTTGDGTLEVIIRYKLETF